MKKFNITNLRLRYKMLLYFSTVLFAVLALVDVIEGLFSFYVGIVIYVLAACTLFSSVYYIVVDFRHEIKDVVKPTVAANPYVGRLASDYRLRTLVFAVPGTLGNIVFAVFNGVIGIYSQSAWFGSLSAYYILLSLMRISAVRQAWFISKIEKKEERLRRETAVFRKDSILFIFMAFVLSGMVVLLELSQGGKEYPGLTIYAAAAYAFYKVITSSVNIAKAEKQESPLLAIIRRIGYVDAYVSILTLQTAMFAAFADGQERLTKIMNGATGSFVCLLVFSMGIHGIIYSKKLTGLLKTGGNCND